MATPEQPRQTRWRQFEQSGRGEKDTRRRQGSVHAIVVGENTRVADVIALQRKTIVDMLLADPTGAKKVAVLVDNPLSSDMYADKVEEGLEANRPFQAAEHAAFQEAIRYSSIPHEQRDKADPIHVLKQRSKSPLSTATGVMIDALQAAFPGRIQVIIQDSLPNDQHFLSNEKLNENQRTSLIDFDSSFPIDDRKKDAAKRYRSYYSSLGDALTNRDEQSAQVVEHALVQEDVLGVVLSVETDAAGIIDVLESRRGRHGKPEHTVAVSIPAQLTYTQNEEIILKAKQRILTNQELEELFLQDLDDYRETTQIEGDIDMFLADVMPHDSGPRPEMVDLEMDLMAEGMFSVDEEGQAIQEEAAQDRLDRIRQNARAHAPDIAQALLTMLNNTQPDQQNQAAIAEQVVDYIVNAQADWDMRFYESTERALVLHKDPDDSKVREVKRMADDRLLKYVSKLCGVEITNRDTIGLLMIQAQVADPMGFAKRVQEVQKNFKSEGIGIRLDHLEADTLGLATRTNDQGYGFERNEQVVYVTQDTVSESLTAAILDRKGYDTIGTEEIDRYKDSIRRHIDKVTGHYNEQISELTARYIYAIDNPTPEQREQARHAAEARIHRALDELIGNAEGTPLNTTRERAEAMMRIAIADQGEFMARVSKAAGSDELVNHAYAGETMAIAFGFGIPSEDEYRKAQEWADEEPAPPRKELNATGREILLGLLHELHGEAAASPKEQEVEAGDQDGARTVGSHRSQIGPAAHNDRVTMIGTEGEEHHPHVQDDSRDEGDSR